MNSCLALIAVRRRKSLVGAIVFASAAVVTLILWWRWRPSVQPPERVVSERTRAAVRAEERRKDREDIIVPGLRQSVTTENHESCSRVLWTMKWTNYREADSLAPMRDMLRQTAWPEESRRLLLETCYALQPDALAAEMESLAAEETDPRLWAMAVAYGRRATGKPAAVPRAATDTFRHDPRVLAAQSEDREPRAALAQRTPPLTDLLAWDFGDRPVVFSFQRANRDFPGRAAVRRADGTWLTHDDGAVWTVRQFARSVSNLPGTITNGNTPAGVMGLRELAFARNAAIGPTRALTLALPGEYEPWTHREYERLLPPSWRGHWPMQEAWWAGQVGRNEIMAHGTTIDPESWLGSPFYPLTPSHGCLTCHEEWSPQTGERRHSDQQDLVDAVVRAGGAPAWFVVVECESPETSATPVSAEEIEGFIRTRTP
ncbi:MAG: hypothetical protein ACKV19_18040 [Verrucomicrobiales bacterium]